MNILKRIYSNPGTSGIGLAALVSLGLGAYQNPAVLQTEGFWTAAILAAGLIVAADAKSQNPPAPPPPPVPAK